MIDLCVCPPIYTHPPNMRSVTVSHETRPPHTANARQQPHSLGLADGDALVEALLVVEVLEGVEDGALLLACVAVWTAEKKLPRADYCMYVGNNAPRSFYR